MARMGIVTAALGALLAGGAAALESRFRGFPGALPAHGDGGKTTSRSGRGGGTRRESAKSSCTADASADAYAGSLDGYASAVADLVADVCDPRWDGSLQVLRDDMRDVAAAWARATVQATAGCASEVTGGGRAKACAYSEAAAFAFEIGVAAAHADATSHAFASCKCNNAQAWTFSEAETVKTLIADVYTTAAATACATGNQVSEAAASVDCAARVFVDVYAKAVAEAAVNADCVAFSDNAAYSNVITAIETEVDWNEACNSEEFVRGSADTEVYGDTYADAYDS